MLGNRSWDDWIAQYATSHQNPVNRICHLFGIPMIAVSIPLLALALVWPVLLWPAAVLFIGGWALQFAGHAVEGKLPEFFSDWRFLFVGLRWWIAKMMAKI